MGFLVKKAIDVRADSRVFGYGSMVTLTVYPFSRAIDTIDEKDGPASLASEEAGEYSLKM
jgi:hypothetical protein